MSGVNPWIKSFTVLPLAAAVVTTGEKVLGVKFRFGLICKRTRKLGLFNRTTTVAVVVVILPLQIPPTN